MKESLMDRLLHKVTPVLKLPESEHQLREVEITKLTKPDNFEGSDSMQSEFKGARGEERSRSLRSWPGRSLQEYFDHRMGESTESHSLLEEAAVATKVRLGG